MSYKPNGIGSALDFYAAVASIPLAAMRKVLQGVATDEAATHEATSAVVDDGGWWCSEHAVPEEECASLPDPSARGQV